jgi:hypothetical protein
LGPLVGHDFAHLDHVPAWLSWHHQPRTNNNIIRTPEDPPPEYRPTGPDWGLARYELDLRAVPARVPADEVWWRLRHWPQLVWAAAAGTACTVAMLFRDQIRFRGVVRGIGCTLLYSTGIMGRLRRGGG